MGKKKPGNVFGTGIKKTLPDGRELRGEKSAPPVDLLMHKSCLRV
ncbi:MAG TPA: hypothetical protein VFU32_07730 [Ktedonobacterales bacterium]|nr:hypothetical protein [Ktedonobacterales bacterium]